MGTLLFGVTAGVLIVAGLSWLVMAGFRNGDRALDATLGVELCHSGQPDEPRPVIVTEIRNPSGTALMVGLSARRYGGPGWMATGGARVPWRTTGRGLRAGRYDTVGVVPGLGTGRFEVPVCSGPGRRYLLTAAIGQAGGRLRVHRRPVDDRDRLWLPVADLTGWQQVLRGSVSS